MLVAESLQRLPEPLEPILTSPPVTAGAGVLAAMATALRPELAGDAAPDWLRPEQVGCFRRTLAALRRHGGALLAEPVGTGKTWIALAVAAAHSREPSVVFAPAAVTDQWRTTTSRLGVPIQVHSHESLSRGRPPAASNGLVVVDESHWFRTPATRRYRVLASWLVGRPVLLVTATPVVNRAADLAHQLRLCLRDDALSAAGLPSLRLMTAESERLEALAEVVVAGFASGGERPALSRGTTRLRPDRRLTEVLRELDRLGLSTDPAVAALVRTSLWGAAASSPAALSAALLRYQALLDHAEDAARAGQRLGREALRRFIAADPTQLVLWELLPVGESTGDLVLDDRAALGRLRSRVERWADTPDQKALALRELLADGRRSLVFTGSIATVRYLWRHLDGPVAWCTGSRAGIGATVLPREAVLAWFRPEMASSVLEGLPTPKVLVATDVAAEGLDLQGAERVVHYDIPWTAVRTDQRTGRVHRLGSPHAAVDEHWLLPPRSLGVRLGVERAVARKRRLPGRMGIGEASSAWWRVRQAATSAFPNSEGRPGLCEAWLGGAHLANGDAVACIRIESGPSRGATRLLVHRAGLGWRADEARALELLVQAASGRSVADPDPERLRTLTDELAEPVRAALRQAAGRHWAPGSITPAVARLLRRLRHWARIAARARDGVLLEQLDHAVRALGRGLTAGEELRLTRLAAREDASLHEHLAALPKSGPPLAMPGVRLIGVIAFRPDDPE